MEVWGWWSGDSHSHVRLLHLRNRKHELLSLNSLLFCSARLSVSKDGEAIDQTAAARMRVHRVEICVRFLLLHDPCMY